jgi:hypothetical protein
MHNLLCKTWIEKPGVCMDTLYFKSKEEEEDE